MTQQAFNKIGIAFALLLIAIGVCCWIDTACASDESISSNALSTENSLAERTEGLSTLLEGDEGSTMNAARSIFDIPLNTELPDEFATEALDASSFEEAFVSGANISFTYAGSCDEAENLCADILKNKGWYALESNDQAIQSFAKAEGNYRWLVLQYLSLDEKTVIVVSAIDPDQP